MKSVLLLKYTVCSNSSGKRKVPDCTCLLFTYLQDHSSRITIPLGNTDADVTPSFDVYNSCAGSNTMCWPMHWLSATACAGPQQQQWGHQHNMHQQQQWGYPQACGSAAPYSCPSMQHIPPPAAGYFPVPQKIPTDAHGSTYQHSSSFWPLLAAVAPVASYQHQYQLVPCAQEACAWQQAYQGSGYSHASPGSNMTYSHQAPHQHSTETACGFPTSHLQQQQQLHAQQYQPAHAPWWPFQAAYTANRVQRLPAQLGINPEVTQEPAPLSFSGWQAAATAAASAEVAAPTVARGSGALAHAAHAGAVTRLAHGGTTTAARNQAPATSSVSVILDSHTDDYWAGLQDSFRPQSPWQPSKHAVKVLNSQSDSNMGCMLGSSSTAPTEMQGQDAVQAAEPAVDATAAAVEAEAGWEDWQEVTSYWAGLKDSFRPQSPWQPSQQADKQVNASCQGDSSSANSSTMEQQDSRQAAGAVVDPTAAAVEASAPAVAAHEAVETEAACEDLQQPVDLQELTSDVPAAADNDQATQQQHSMVPKHSTADASDTNEAADSSSAAKNSYKAPTRAAPDATKRRMRASDWAVPYFASNGASEGRHYRKSRLLR